MNRSVDPCNDFYEYACGNWPKENPLPVGYNQWDMLTKLQIKTNKQVEGDQFVCPLPSVKFKIRDLLSTFAQYILILSSFFTEIVKAEPTESDLEVVKLAKKWYKVCTDTGEYVRY